MSFDKNLQMEKDLHFTFKQNVLKHQLLNFKTRTYEISKIVYAEPLISTVALTSCRDTNLDRKRQKSTVMNTMQMEAIWHEENI